MMARKKTRAMKTKEIPDHLLLELLAQRQGSWAFLHESGELSWPGEGKTVVTFARAPVPRKLMLSKFRSLHKRGFVGGCPCGCRGDFEITDKGLELLGQPRLKPYTGY